MELPGEALVLEAEIEVLSLDEDEKGGILTDVLLLLVTSKLLDGAGLLTGRVVLFDEGNGEGRCEDPSTCEELGGFADEGERAPELAERELAPTNIENRMLAPAVDEADALAVCERPNMRLEGSASIAL